MFGEQLVSTLGGMLSLTAITALSYFLLGQQGAIAVVPSMGAATVLLFAVPHGPLSQPWALFIGTLISALVGVTCAKFIANPVFAAGFAVGLAIAAMHLLRCMHPPGGATALAAVIGGERILNLGYTYVITPVLLNCVIIFVVAVAFNNLFGWRRYPAAAMRYRPIQRADPSAFQLSREQLQQGLRDVGGLIDISKAQLQQIVESAMRARSSDLMSRIDMELGGVYTNNKPGAQWAIRKIIDYAKHPDPRKELIIYKVLDGAEKNTTGSCNKEEFAQWAAQRLKPVSGA